MLDILVFLKKIMIFGLLHSTVQTMKLYTGKMRIKMKLQDFLETLTDTVRFGENFQLQFNQHIGWFGHTLNLKVGVID